MKHKQVASPPPNLDGLSEVQKEHVMRVFPESRAQMADYLREGAQVTIGRQNEASGDVPPYAISVLKDREFWIDCCDTPEEARQRVSALGLVLVE